MKEIDVKKITETVKDLCITANKTLPSDIEEKIYFCSNCEKNSLAKSVLSDIENNLKAAKDMNLPICQDTGMAVVFLDIGQDVHLVGGNLSDAVNLGVKLGYEQGLLRKSVVNDPLLRVNTDDNTPAVIHTRIVEGDCVTVTVAPKGFGSENMSGISMLKPAVGKEGVVNAILETVKKASNNPCPPIVVGVGIGGDFEQCALLSKIALCRDINIRNSNSFYADLEKELLDKINSLDIGPQGFGGDTTALAVNIETAPTHIAGLPVAVNIGCFVTRHATAVIE
ncbi:MAG: fumarate hydratase [Clostridia bacterium]|nr:fumarate hydratase [Clostridia bacterium]